MKAHLLTDIHNEYRDASYRVVDLDFDILIPAGDIDSDLAGITWAAEESQRLGVPAIYVPGNHEFYDTTVVVSHHGPSQLCVHSKWTASIVSNAYCSHLDNLVIQADYWFYGHTHAALDTRVEQTRLLTNSAGYPGQETGFSPSLVLI